MDSQAAIKALTKPSCTKNTYLTYLIKEKKKNITLNWIKAHVGHKQNKVADTLAKEGTKTMKLQKFIIHITT